MLIYNHKFEFVGVDKQDLTTLGFNSLEELQNHCDDFADLFVKKPSYIYNFKNFKWILYILNSNSEQSKAIISAKDRTFAVDLNVDIVYLTNDPKEEAYKILLRNLHQIDGEQIPTNLELLQEPSQVENVSETEPSMELPSDNELTAAVPEPVPEHVPDAPLDIYDSFDDLPEENSDDDVLDLLEEQPLEEEEDHLTNTEQPMLGDYVSPTVPAAAHDADEYLFDPEVAAKELGLPVVLIEEFIGDFIHQAHSFKHDLYNSLEDRDFDQIKSLSHKLKGVAANLRIEDAFKALSIINTTNDLEEIKTNLDYFYLIVAKLEGKEIATTQPVDNVAKVPEVKKTVDEELVPIEEIEEDNDDDLYANLLLDDETHVADSNLNILDYDKDQAANELGLDEELIQQLLQDYKEQLSTALHKMQELLNDTDAVKHLAVNLKGVSDNLRLNQISQALNMIITSSNQSTVQEALASLEQYTTQL